MLAQTIVILGGLGVFLTGHLLLLERYLDARLARIDTRIDGLDKNIDRRFDQIETRIVRIEDTFLKDYGERIARLERTH